MILVLFVLRVGTASSHDRCDTNSVYDFLRKNLFDRSSKTSRVRCVASSLIHILVSLIESRHLQTEFIVNFYGAHFLYVCRRSRSVFSENITERVICTCARFEVFIYRTDTSFRKSHSLSMYCKPCDTTCFVRHV